MKRRQERAQKIAEREEYTEKRNRLLNVLVQKLLVRNQTRYMLEIMINAINTFVLKYSNYDQTSNVFC